MQLHLDFGVVLERWPLFLQGALATLWMALLATALGFALGVLCAVGRRDGPRWLRWLCAAYVEAIRNTPLLVQLLLVFFGLSSLGLQLPAFGVAAAALAINAGAYAAEIMRAGFDAVPPGQLEAGAALGLSRAQVYWHVLLRPAMETVWPALTSQFVLLMLASSVTSQISAEELTAAANYVQSDTYRAFETYILVAVLYLALAVALRALFRGLAWWLFPRRRAMGLPP